MTVGGSFWLPVGGALKEIRPGSELPEDLQKLYTTRFTGHEGYRTKIWILLTSKFFSHWVKPHDTVLDLGCGYGEFINNISAGKKYAMDLNPSTKNQILPEVEFLERDCSLPWPLPDNVLDIVFTSNFFEHLPTKKVLLLTMTEAHRCLKPGGRLIALGPNVKYLPGTYWDFFDHYLPLTELSIAELMSLSGLEIEQSIDRFLPYTMSMGYQPATWKVSLYLRIPFAWKLFGRQFLVVGRKPVSATATAIS
jgi:SAM-dependent methyltransferase